MKSLKHKTWQIILNIFYYSQYIFHTMHKSFLFKSYFYLFIIKKAQSAKNVFFFSSFSMLESIKKNIPHTIINSYVFSLTMKKSLHHTQKSAPEETTHLSNSLLSPMLKCITLHLTGEYLLSVKVQYALMTMDAIF